MPEFDAATLAAWSTGEWKGTPPRPVSGFCIDTRILKPGQLFVALRSGERDGHDYLHAAEAAGAAAALVERFRPDSTLPQLVVKDTLRAFQRMAREHRRQFSGKVVAVTGSCGKTSTKDLLAHLLGSERTHRTHENFNNHLGVPLTLLALDPRHHEIAVIEAGINRRGEMADLGAMIEPDAVVITGVAAAHLEALGNLSGVGREKGALLRFVKPGGVAVWPASCLEYAAFSEPRAASLRTFVVAAPEAGPKPKDLPSSYALTKCETEIVPAGSGGNCRLRLRQLPFLGELVVEMPAISEGMRSNVALALTLATALGINAATLQERMQSWRPSVQRGELRTVGERTYYVDCYNANPASMRDSLQHFQNLFPEPPRCFVLGGMKELGEGSASLHRETGAGLELASSDFAILVGEEASSYADGLVSRGTPTERFCVAGSERAAADALRHTSGPVFLKGSRAYHLETLIPVSGEAERC